MGKDVNIIKNTCFFFVCLFCVYCSLLGFFCIENIRKKWSSTKQASNKTVAKKSWRYLFANPDRYVFRSKLSAEIIYSLQCTLIA